MKTMTPLTPPPTPPHLHPLFLPTAKGKTYQKTTTYASKLSLRADEIKL